MTNEQSRGGVHYFFNLILSNIYLLYNYIIELNNRKKKKEADLSEIIGQVDDVVSNESFFGEIVYGGVVVSAGGVALGTHHISLGIDHWPKDGQCREHHAQRCHRLFHHCHTIKNTCVKKKLNIVTELLF